MKYYIVPKGKKGCCHTVCHSAEEAEREKKKLEVITGGEREIMDECRESRGDGQRTKDECRGSRHICNGNRRRGQRRARRE